MWVRFPPPALDSGRFSTFALAKEFSFSEDSLVLRVGPDGSPHFDE